MSLDADEKTIYRKESSKASFGLFAKIFISRFASSGELRQCIMSMIHVAQACSISRPVMEKTPSSFQVIWNAALDLIGSVKEWAGWKNVTEEHVLAFTTVSISLFLFSLMFTFHIGMSVTGYSIYGFILLSPLFICLGFVQEMWLPAAAAGVLLLLGVVVLWLQKKREDAEDINCCGDCWCTIFAPLRVLYQIFAFPWTVFRDNAQLYILYGEKGPSREGGRKRFSVVASLMMASCWVMITLVSFVYNNLLMFGIFLGVAVILTIVVSIIFKILKASYNDIRALTDLIYFFYMDAIYSPVIDKIVNYVTNYRLAVVWPLVAYAVIFCVALPLLYRILFTIQAGKLAMGVSSDKYEEYIENGKGGYASLCSGFRQKCFWWPAFETFMKIGYSVTSALNMPLIAIIIMGAFAVAMILCRPYTQWSSFVIGLGEVLVILVMNLMGEFLPEETTLSNTVMIVVFIGSFLPVVISIIVFTIWELPSVYEETLFNIRESEQIKKKMGRIAGLRNALGLAVTTTKIDTIDDLPVFMSNDKLLSEYPDVMLKLKEFSREEARKYEEMKVNIVSGTEYKNVEEAKKDANAFYIDKLGLDPKVIDESIKDSELSSEQLAKRVEYRSDKVMRKLHCFQFPAAFLVFTACLNFFCNGYFNLDIYFAFPKF